MRLSIILAFAAGWLVLEAKVSFGEAPSLADAAFFESKVRPLLISKCHECHGEKNPKSGLRLDSRVAILKGGDSGPAAVGGKPEKSLLIEAIGYRGSIQMPPKSKLPDSEIAILTEWVQRGMPWPNSSPAVTSPNPSAALAEFTDEQKSFWAFQPVRRLLPPVVNHPTWVRSPIDDFVLAELESKDLLPAKESDRRRLLRRVTIDLIGLLPTEHEVAEFVKDNSPDAFERVVDRLLASPHYGERWARHWLDVARYADSNGLDENLAYANAYRYRDYVVGAFREDKPYDRFLIEQIAGDLLESNTDDVAGPSSNAAAFEPLIATGFLCLGAKMLAEDDPVKMQMDIIDEQVDTIARAVMGLTMGCARCHDHKYDPLTTDDYYGLAGVFKSTQTMDTFTVVARWHERPLASTTQIQHRDSLQQLAAHQKQAVEKLKTDATDVILNEARRKSGSYLLAATREWLLSEQLQAAVPRGSDPNRASIPGAILIEAEEYARGNVLKDRDGYGKEIGVLVNRGETPNFTEYDVTIERSATYQFELRYAAASSRPVKASVNGRLAKSDAASRVTGSWTPETQTWFVEGLVTLAAGKNVIRLEQPQFFPHIDKLLFTPADLGDSEKNRSLAMVNQAAKADTGLIPSLVQQWKKTLAGSKTDPTSILTAWNQYVLSQGLKSEESTAQNGIARLLGQAQPTSLDDLAHRYELLFAEVLDAWVALKSSEQGRTATSLPDPVQEAARSLLMDSKGPYAVPADIELSFDPKTAAQLKVGREELTRREAEVPKFPETMAVADSKPENLKIHLRGSHLTLGREVPRQLPRILATGSRELTQGSGRLQLAQWLASREHPLTARVMANRIWQWHFGNGLVRSPDNFGRLGERPSHPALLDWLASEFMGASAHATTRSGESVKSPNSDECPPHKWSIKFLHRRLLETAAYRQSCDYHSAAALVDPENRLLWRYQRQRMDVEVLRDSLLAVSDSLDEVMGGTLLPTPNRAYVTSTANVNPAIYTSRRRSIYLPVVRSALFDVFTAFDFADPSTLAGQRDQTIVAPQALFMMNSQFVLDQSRALAGRLVEQDELTPGNRIGRLYNIAYSRDPSESEISRAIAYIERFREAVSQSGSANVEIDLRAWTSLCRAILSANEFVYLE